MAKLDFNLTIERPMDCTITVFLEQLSRPIGNFLQAIELLLDSREQKLHTMLLRISLTEKA